MARRERYSCKTCNPQGCCTIYEYCVSCCLHPGKVDSLYRRSHACSPQSRARDARTQLKRTDPPVGDNSHSSCLFSMRSPANQRSQGRGVGLREGAKGGGRGEDAYPQSGSLSDLLSCLSHVERQRTTREHLQGSLRQALLRHAAVEFSPTTSARRCQFIK